MKTIRNFLIQKGSIEDIIICEKGGRSVNFICNLLQHPISLLLCPQPRQTEFSQLFADFQLANLQHKYHSTHFTLQSIIDSEGRTPDFSDWNRNFFWLASLSLGQIKVLCWLLFVGNFWRESLCPDPSLSVMSICFSKPSLF